MPQAKALTPRLHRAIAEIPAAQWDELVGDDAVFMRHAWLKALEDTQCVGPGTGWQSLHLGLYDGEDRLRAACPLYAKSHSYGEYVFDHAWAQAFEQSGGAYYPKLVVASPFTPVTGPRLLAQNDMDRAELIKALIELTQQQGLSGLHIQFCRESEVTLTETLGLLPRLDRQYWWTNQGFDRFDDFLVTLSSNRRKVIRRERRDVAHLRFETLEGHNITEAHLDHLYGFIENTYDRKWGRPYLNRDFFSACPRADMVLMIAWDGPDCIAGAVNFRSQDTLYGRQWGCSRDVAFLHFELCYYQAIDYAIAHKIAKVEAGTQGEHKLSRGYAPYPVHSAHWLAHTGLRSAVSDYLDHERATMRREITLIRAEYLPFKSV